MSQPQTYMQYITDSAMCPAFLMVHSAHCWSYRQSMTAVSFIYGSVNLRIFFSNILLSFFAKMTCCKMSYCKVRNLAPSAGPIIILLFTSCAVNKIENKTFLWILNQAFKILDVNFNIYTLVMKWFLFRYSNTLVLIPCVFFHSSIHILIMSVGVCY